MMLNAQFPLALEFLPSHDRDDFLIAPCNAAAAALVDSWPEWAGPHAVVYGASGCGKTHLLSAWAAKSGAKPLCTTDLTIENLNEELGDSHAWTLDTLESANDERLLFHLLNSVRERGGHLLAACGDAPVRLPFQLPDLRSRLAAAITVEIDAPDDSLLGALLIKLFQDRRLDVDPAVIGFMQMRLERTYQAYRSAVRTLDQVGLSSQRRITIPLVRAALFDQGG